MAYEKYMRWQPLALLTVLLIAITIIAAFAPPAQQRTVTDAFIKLVTVLGLFIFIGNSGVFSFGHVGFMAVGGYISAILTISPAKKHVALELVCGAANAWTPARFSCFQNR